MQGDTHAFIVRIWHEAVDSEGRVAIWRGSIDHVGNGQSLYFSDTDNMVRFIRERAGLPPARLDPWWRSLLNWIKHGIT